MENENFNNEIFEEIINNDQIINDDLENLNNFIEEPIEVIESTIDITNEEIQNEENINIEVELRNGIVKPSHLNVRKEASKDSDIIGIVNKDDSLKIIDEFGDFYKVLFNGVEGFCVKEFISVE